jgi:hypothetical protein
MDDFGVWDDTPAPAAPFAPPASSSAAALFPDDDDGFGNDGFGAAADEFDDFGDGFAPAAGAGGNDDDFGDFGDFSEPTADAAFPATEPEPVHEWQALQLRPFPPADELRARIAALVGPLFPALEDLDLAPDDAPPPQVLRTPER